MSEALQEFLYIITGLFLAGGLALLAAWLITGNENDSEDYPT